MEPFAEAVKSTAEIHGVEIANCVHKINLFADDTVLFVSDLIILVPPLLDLIDEFGKVTGFVVNYSKSEAYPVNLSGGDCLEFSY